MRLLTNGLLMVLGLGLIGLSAEADDAEMGRAVLEKNKSAVVTVQIVVKQQMSMEGMGSESYENKEEITGAVIDPQGLTVVSLSESDPDQLYSDMMDSSAMGGMKMDIKTEVTDVKILLEDGTEIPAREVLRDQDLDLAFMRPQEPPSTPMAYVDLTQAGSPKILDRTVALNRLGQVANRAYAASFEYIEAIITKPRTFYVVGNDPTQSALGSPVFTLDGKIVGLIVMRTVKTGGGGGGLFSMFSSDGLMPVILPAEDILEATKSEESAAKKPETAPPPPTATPETPAPAAT